MKKRLIIIVCVLLLIASVSLIAACSDKEEAVQEESASVQSKEIEPKLESISAHYNGDKVGGVMIDENNKDIKVECCYSDGKVIKTDEWSIRNPKKTEWGKNNIYIIECKGKSVELSIETNMTLAQVCNKADKLAKQTIQTYDYKTRYDDNKNQDDEKRYVVAVDIGMELYNNMRDESNEGNAQNEWNQLRGTLSSLCNEIKDLFEANGYDDVVVFTDVHNPGREESQCLIIKDREIKHDFYD